MIDTHSHLYFPEFIQDRDEVIKRARQAGVFLMTQIGASLEDSRKAVDLANQNDDMVASVGIHPYEAVHYLPSSLPSPIKGEGDKKSNNPSPLAGEGRGEGGAGLATAIIELKKIALENKGKVAAIGECGLDFGKTGKIEDKDKEAQIELFEAQIALTHDLNLPLIIHCRNAHREVIQVIKDSGFKIQNIVIHCFTGAWADAKAYLDLGCFISFSGIVTFEKKSEGVREAAAKIPLTQMLIETDAPYLAPEPFRGKRNEPAYVKSIIQSVAELHEISFEEVERATDQNALKIFKK